MQFIFWKFIYIPVTYEFIGRNFNLFKGNRLYEICPENRSIVIIMQCNRDFIFTSMKIFREQKFYKLRWKVATKFFFICLTYQSNMLLPVAWSDTANQDPCKLHQKSDFIRRKDEYKEWYSRSIKISPKLTQYFLVPRIICQRFHFQKQKVEQLTYTRKMIILLPADSAIGCSQTVHGFMYTPEARKMATCCRSKEDN